MLLFGCDQAQSDARTVTLVLVKSDAEVKQHCGDDMILEPLGCAKVAGASCRIVAYEPRGFDDHRRLETLGHELWHCYRGPKHI